jgi:hypothetical protein
MRVMLLISASAGISSISGISAEMLGFLPSCNRVRSVRHQAMLFMNNGEIAD